MALSIGKLGILVGAGILGSVLAKEGRVSDLVSGAFKIALKQIKSDDTSSRSSAKKPNSDHLMAQVNSLRQELQILASSNRSVTIVTTGQSGTGKYGIIIITVVVGYGYIWWKGWRLPDMMFATRRSLSDACSSISKQLENVYTSIASVKRKLSSQIDGLEHGLDECLETTSRTREEVSEIHGLTEAMAEEVRSVGYAFENLVTRMSRIEGNQDITNEGVRRLLDFTQSVENRRSTERFQAISSSSSRLAIEPSPMSPSPSRSESLPLGLFSEPASPTDSVRSLQEGNNGLSDAIIGSSNDGVVASEDSGSRFGLRFSGITASFLTRTRSATNSMLQQTRSAGTQRL